MRRPAVGPPHAGAPAPRPSRRAARRRGGSALVVGDSIALGSADSLRRALGAGTTVDAKVGRQFSAAPGIVAAWAAVNDGPVVIDLGANGTVAADDVDAVIAAAGDRRVVLVGVHVPRRWQDGNNDVLRAAAAAHPTVAFVDWDALVDANPGVLGPDGVHPGAGGPHPAGQRRRRRRPQALTHPPASAQRTAVAAPSVPRRKSATYLDGPAARRLRCWSGRVRPVRGSDQRLADARLDPPIYNGFPAEDTRRVSRARTGGACG